jgi:hypothetical protein
MHCQINWDEHEALVRKYASWPETEQPTSSQTVQILLAIRESFIHAEGDSWSGGGDEPLLQGG